MKIGVGLWQYGRGGGIGPKPIPSPLDYTEYQSGLSNITIEYDLARPVAMLGVTFRHDGNVTSLTATHGGEPLELVALALDDVESIGAAAFIGNGLTIEPADLVITPTGGTIGPALVRIDDSFDLDVVAADHIFEQNGQSGPSDPNQPDPAVFTGLNGDSWVVYALATSSAVKESYARGTLGGSGMRLLFNGAVASGGLVDAPDFVPTSSTWHDVDGWWEHDGPSTGLGNALLSEVIEDPFWCEVEVDIAAGSALYIAFLNADADGHESMAINGPAQGLYRVYSPQGFRCRGFRAFGAGYTKFRNLQYCVDGHILYGAFGRTNTKIREGTTVQFKIVTPSRYAGVIMAAREE